MSTCSVCIHHIWTVISDDCFVLCFFISFSSEFQNVAQNLTFHIIYKNDSQEKSHKQKTQHTTEKSTRNWRMFKGPLKNEANESECDRTEQSRC